MVKIYEETLRDGIQSSELSMLNTEDKKKVIKNFDNAGIEGCCIGFINSSKKENDEINELFQFIITNKLKIVPAVLCRLLIEDFKEIKNIVQCNLFNQLKVYTYIAVSPIRMKVENWSEEIIIEKIIDFLNYCQMENAKITIAFDDASRADKSFLKKLIEIINNYPLVKSVVIADTVGTCNYNSTRDLVYFFRKNLFLSKTIEWHGHNDLGLAVSNALSAIESGADIVHTCTLGIGERCGNTSTEQLIINLIVSECGRRATYKLRYLYDVAKILENKSQFPISPKTPCFGMDSFFTCAGTHASSLYKSYLKNDNNFSIIFSPYDSNIFGREVTVGINSQSGRSSIEYISRKYGLELSQENITSILGLVKQNDLFFREEEFVDYVKQKRVERLDYK